MESNFKANSAGRTEVASKAARYNARVMGKLRVIHSMGLVALPHEVDLIRRGTGLGLNHWFSVEVGGFVRVVHTNKWDVTIFVTVSTTCSGGGNMRRREVQPFARWLE